MKNSKIVLSYVSSDVYLHPVGKALYAIIQNHDRDKFEINVFYTHENRDIITQEIERNVDRFILAGNISADIKMSSKEMYDTIRSIKTNILIDTNGHTSGGCRLPLFCKRPALLQVTMLGYPNTTMLDCFDLKFASEITAPNLNEFTEPIFSNPFGYMPIFKSVFCDMPVWKDEPIITMGVVSTIAKISDEDILYYDSLLDKYPDTRLIYARLGKQYTDDKAQHVMSLHNNKDRVVILNLGNAPYLKVFEMCDVILDQGNWCNHALMIDALSCGVPVILNPKHECCAARTSRDVYHELELDSSIEWILEDRQCIQQMSEALYTTMRTFDNSKQWTKAYEDAIAQAWERKNGALQIKAKVLPDGL